MTDETSIEEQFTCAIWGSPARLVAGDCEGDARIQSWRAGGDYRIDRTARRAVDALTFPQKARLTTWLVEQRRAGVEAPLVSLEKVREERDRRPLKFSDKRERFFRALGVMKFGPGDARPISKGRRHFGGSGQDRLALIAAWIDAVHLEEAWGLVELMAADGYLTLDHQSIRLTTKGLDKIEALENSGADSRQVFVAMWFGPEMNEAWTLGIAPGVRDAGYEPFRIDGKEHNNKIDDEIVAEIKRSRFLIADFTCGSVEADGKRNAIPRGGVYYEAGLAHGLGMEVMFACRADLLDDVHFDTRQFAHIVWETPEDLRAKLYNRIVATVGEAPGAPGRGMGAVR